MAKKTGRRGRHAPLESVTETRAAEVVTVAWMLAAMTTLLCEVSAIAGAWMLKANPEFKNLMALEAVLVFSSLVVGIISVVLALTARKLRREQPPSGLMVASLVIGAAPGLRKILIWEGRSVFFRNEVFVPLEGICGSFSDGFERRSVRCTRAPFPSC